MKTYILSMLAAALVAAVVGILSPSGEGGGISKHMRLLCSLFLLCVLLSPLISVLDALGDLANGSFLSPDVELEEEEDYRDRLEGAMDEATRTYFAQMLTECLCDELSLKAGEVRCHVLWDEEDGTPKKVTVLLSGSAIWQDPKRICSFVTSLLDCECVCALE